VGIEDGLVEFAELGGEVLNVGAAVVTDGQREGLGFTSLFAYPPACLESALTAREPIGGLFDAFWQAHKGAASPGPSGRSLGNIGMLSQGVLPRSEYGRHAVVCALVGFLHPELYPARFLGRESSVEDEGSGLRPRVSGSG
jgi:non-canonical (house-cleaning) NTP pyrophosphatase